ncbi:hypothetical protein GN244_ATG04118 [Phytophthora infestans]|uniref:Uncharacterized protein n=1 Tax=Phytophthora infestans TaxID=4787 RepID=A0A833S9L0_PHYIN|nr:hypothetical protein GN244_ATG04118 [Phytophthora infestans]
MRRESPPKLDNNAESSRIPPPTHAHTFGYAGAHVATNLRRGWRPESDGGRHDSPIFRRHCKRLSSSSIDINSGRESEPSTVTTSTGQQQESRTQQTSPSIKPNMAPATPPVPATTTSAEMLAVQPPRTPQGRSTYPMFDDGGLSAAQRVRMELPSHSGSRAGSDSRANSSEDIFASNSPVFDEKKNGPRSCPSSYKDVGGNKTRLSPGKGRQVRSGELIVSKLLPTRDSVNSLLTYLHELQISEASLHKQLMTTKQHTEEELYQSLLKLNELQRTMHKVERDRQVAEQRLEEKEQRIRELAAKLEKAETTQARLSPARSPRDGLPPITEEISFHRKEKTSAELSTYLQEASAEETPALSLEVPFPSTQAVASSLRPPQLQSIKDEAAQFATVSPRSPNRPLWDPWASGGTTPMKNLPPAFTIGPTAQHPVVTSPASTEEPAATKFDENELRSVLKSPRDRDEPTKSVSLTPQAENQLVFRNLPFEQEEREPQHPAPMPPPHPRQHNFDPVQVHGGAEMQKEQLIMEFLSQTDPLLYVGAMPPIHESPLEQQEDNSAEADLKNNDMTALIVAKQTASRLPRALAENLASEGAMPHDESGQVSQPEQASRAEAEDAGTRVSNSTTAGFCSSPRTLLAGVQLDLPVKKQSKAVPTNPVSLEALLLDFFTEVDKNRLKMATVYGKRYAGREKWLFTELAKRYGAAKVAALKARYEHGTNVSTGDNSGDKKGKRDDHATKSSDSSGRSKASRQGHPQFFHPPKPACNANPGAGKPRVSLPVAPSQENNAPNSQPGQEIEAKAPPSPSEKVSRSNTPAFGDPPSFPTTQKSDESDSAVKANIDGPSVTNRPPLAQRDKPSGSLNQPPPPLHRGMETSNSAPVGLRQRHNASGPSAQGPKTDGTERPAVTVEGLLKELYKNHQPDKLKNVSIVAKEYAGKEPGKGAGKKRGCFVRTISLLLWLSVLLYFSFGAVFVSFVVLDAWECRALDKDGQELESAEECVSLQEELDAFTYEHVADYIRQSHPDICFCSEWKARENALFTTLSGDDLMNLVRLVPFSPDSFGSAWIASVKEQAPSQECYNNYAKPVVDLWLDVGSFLWSSVLELAGYDEVCEVKSQTVESVVENENPSVDEESDSNTDAGSLEQASEEMESESSISEVEIDPDLTEETEADGQLTEETETNGGFVPADEVPVEEETLRFDDGPQIGEEESLLFGPEVVDKTSAQVSEDVEAVEKAESVDAIVEALTEDDCVLALRKIEEAELDADTESTGVDGTAVMEDDSVITTPVEETDAIDRGADAASSSVTVEVVDATVDVSGEESVVEEVATELDDVVKIEVLEEGVSLSYAETVTDVTKEELTAEFTEGFSSSALGSESEPVISSRLGEAEVKMNVEFENIVVDLLEKSGSTAAAAAEDTMPSSANVVAEGVTESTSHVDASESIVEMEDVDGESVWSEALEEDIASEVSEESDTVTHEAAGKMSALGSRGGEVYATLSEKAELVTGRNELEVVIEVESETANGKWEVVTEDRTNDVVEAVAESRFELPSSSYDVDAAEPQSEESSSIASKEDAKGVNDVDKVGEESFDAPVAVPNVELASSRDDFEPAVPAETNSPNSGLEPEADVVGAVDETILQELVNELNSEASIQTCDIELVAVEEAEELTFLFKTEPENLESGVDNDAEPSTKQFVPDVDVGSERGKEPEASSEADMVDTKEPVDKVGGCVSDGEEITLCSGKFEALDKMPQATGLMVTGADAIKPRSSDVDDIEEDEEIAFMEDLENPEAVLRMAEQAAAAAEFSAIEPR